MPQHIKSETWLLLLFFQPAPSSSVISVKTHRKVLLSLYSFSAPRSALAKEASTKFPGVETQIRSYGTAGAIPVSHWGWHTALAPWTERVGSCLWGQWPWPSFPRSLPGCKSMGHISTRQRASSLWCTRTSGRGNPEILPSLGSNNYEYPQRCQRPQKKKTPQRKTLHGKAS